MSKFRPDKVCIVCKKGFFPINGKMQRCIDCHYLYKSKIKLVSNPTEPIKTIQSQAVRIPKYLAEYKGSEESKFSFMVRRRWQWILQSAKNRNISFFLTIEHLREIINLPCYYCGIEKYNFSVDREDNHMGYVDENVFPCCRSCNSRKNTKSSKEFIATL